LVESNLHFIQIDIDTTKLTYSEIFQILLKSIGEFSIENSSRAEQNA